MSRKKKRTHRVETDDPAKKGPPKTFVFAHGKHRSLVQDLQADMRKVMQPFTAVNMKVSRNNVMKDFVHVSGPLGITHFVILSGTDKASYIKLCKVPRGPTAVLKILRYALIRDVQAALTRPRMPEQAFAKPPLVVLSGFGDAQHMKLTGVLFQNMFPSINVSKAKLTDCKRVILLTYDQGSEVVVLRHYSISVTASGLTKGVKSVVNGKVMPDLSAFTDIADFVERAGYASESEGEDAAASRVKVLQGTGRSGAGEGTSRVRLHEIGPRLDLQLVKVQQGLAEGRVLYHRFEERSAEEVAQQQLHVEEAARVKAERRREQEENVRRKAREKARVDLAKQVEAEKAQRKRQKESSERVGGSGKLPKRPKGAKREWWEESEDEDGAAADEDERYYEAEVGEAVDEHFGVNRSNSARKAR